MSPEALRFVQEHQGNEKAHYRGGPGDDLYALGVVLYRLLTGTRPFAPDTKEEAAVISRPAVAAYLVNPGVPRALSEVCTRLLEKEAGRRYASAELVRVLEGLLAAGRRGLGRVPPRGAYGGGGEASSTREGQGGARAAEAVGGRAVASALLVAGLVGVTWAASRGGAPGQETPTDHRDRQSCRG